MVWVIVFLVLIIIVLVRYIYKLRSEIRAHEKTWMSIETLTDHNKDGDIVIHCRHVENDK